MFGDYFVESTDDDIGEAFMAHELDPDDCFADVEEDGNGGYFVTIRENDSGDEVVTTDEGLFDSPFEAHKWAKSWVETVNDNF